jgi:hypothetical protein
MSILDHGKEDFFIFTSVTLIVFSLYLLHNARAMVEHCF